MVHGLLGRFPGFITYRNVGTCICKKIISIYIHTIRVCIKCYVLLICCARTLPIYGRQLCTRLFPGRHILTLKLLGSSYPKHSLDSELRYFYISVLKETAASLCLFKL